MQPAAAATTTTRKALNCGTKAADVLANLLAGILYRESSENVCAVATALTSQCMSIQSVAPSATVWS